MTRKTYVVAVAASMLGCSAHAVPEATQPPAQHGAQLSSSDVQRGTASDVQRNAAPANTEPAMPALRAPTEPITSETSAQTSPAPAAENAWRRLPVPGFGDAVLTVPRDATRPLPVLMAVHGAGDAAEPKCAFWTSLVQGQAIVVCPRGTPIDRRQGENGGHYFVDHFALEKEALATLQALRAALPKVIAAGPVVYAGYSQGATMGALMLVHHADLFRRVVLVEGGGDQWTRSIGKTYARAGGERVFFICGTAHCAERTRRAATWLSDAGIASRAVYVPHGGHTYGGSVGERIAVELPWVLDGDERWQGVVQNLRQLTGAH